MKYFYGNLESIVSIVLEIIKIFALAGQTPDDYVKLYLQTGQQARFDFKGNILPADVDIPVNMGLHHHGDEPEVSTNRGPYLTMYQTIQNFNKSEEEGH